MAKKTKRSRRSAIVPAVVLSAGMLCGAAVVPVLLAGCGGGGPQFTVAAAFDMSGILTVANLGFDMSANDLPQFFVAAAFDMTRED